MKYVALVSTGFALALAATPALAGDGGDLPAPTVFTMQYERAASPELPQQKHEVAVASTAQTKAVFEVEARDHGVWLFPPNMLGGGTQ